MKAEPHPYLVFTALGISGNNLGNGTHPYPTSDRDFSALIEARC